MVTVKVVELVEDPLVAATVWAPAADEGTVNDALKVPVEVVVTAVGVVVVVVVVVVTAVPS